MKACPGILHGLLVMVGLTMAGLLGGCAERRDTADYVQLTQTLRAEGFLRTEYAPADAEFSADDLARAFEEIVFRYEFHFRDGVLVEAPIAKPLKRWQGPVRYRLTGDGVTAADRQTVTELFAVVRPLTGLDFRESDEADLLISIASKAGRAAVSEELSRLGRPGYRERYEIWRATPAWRCGATLSSGTDMPNRLVFAHVFLAAELSALMRKGCLHEEIVQSLGLTNDSATARPSIFNDDNEFVLLTEHDALLLQALYDSRLVPGMDTAAAVPLVRRILTELLRDRMLERVGATAPHA